MEDNRDLEYYLSVRRKNDFDEMLTEFNREGMKPVAAREYKRKTINPNIEISGSAIGFKLKIGLEYTDIHGMYIYFE